MQAYPVDQLLASLPPGSYQDIRRCARDVSNCINVHPTLHPEIAFNRTILIKGTIPIEYNDTLYHFPVEIELPQTYPHHAPKFKVTPTAELKILPGHRHVDQFGVVFHSYLNQWNALDSNLAELVIVVAQEFAKAPPLYAPQIRAPPPPPSYAELRTPPPPPPPVYSNNNNNNKMVGTSTGQAFKKRVINKIVFRMESQVPKLQREVQTGMEHSELLSVNKVNVHTQEQAVQKAETQLEENLSLLHIDIANCQERIQQERNKDICVDDWVEFSDPVSLTLFTNVTESLALEDVLDQWDKRYLRMVDSTGVDSSAAALRTHLRMVRNLSREKFLKHALAVKLYQQLPPPPPQSSSAAAAARIGHHAYPSGLKRM